MTETVPKHDIPLIFDAGPGEVVPSGFNASRLVLDGGVRSDLSWTKQIAQATSLREAGLRIFWELDLGLLTRLELPLSDEQQFRSLSIAMQHFVEQVWPQFSEDSVGLCVYRGSGDYALLFPWDDERRGALRLWLKDFYPTIGDLRADTHRDLPDFSELDENMLQTTAYGRQILRLFCRDCLTHYLEMLTAGLPAYLSLYALIDMSGLGPEQHLYQLAHREVFDDIQPIVRGAPPEAFSYCWEQQQRGQGFLGRILPEKTANDTTHIGVCLPRRTVVSPTEIASLGPVLAHLRKEQVPFRILAENFLSSDWEGLDYIVILSATLGLTAVRMLQGFCAAGGTIITIGDALGLPAEITFDEALKSGIVTR